MLAGKRPRRAASAEDSLDPRVMTERQQLAFLLRATAPSDASGSSSDSDSSSDDDEPPRPRRPVKRSKTRATRANGTTGKTSPRTGDAPVIYCGRGRPPKNSIKLPKNSPLHPHARAARMSPRSHNTRSGDAAVAAAVSVSLKAKKMAAGRVLKTQRKEPVKQEKTSPSSASDVAMLGSAAAAPLCALCCDLEPFCDAPLFLCPACDQKYPTQQALGRVCMT
ncbi:hypothetical protein PRIC2_008003 [Phytophthora ramorum]